MKKIVLTGFGEFGKVKTNPTRLIAEAFEKEDGIESFVLPVEYDYCFTPISEITGEIFIHTGVAESRDAITIEKYAYNENKSFTADNIGLFYNGDEIIEGGDDILSSPFDIELLAAALEKEGITASPSTDPGRYVCNNLYYQSLYKGNRALFIHFPSLKRMTIEEDIRALTIIIKHLGGE